MPQIYSQFPETVLLTNLSPLMGISFVGNTGEYSGTSVNSAGDVNGDGITDIIIGAPGANNYAGSSYIIFGNVESWQTSFSPSSLSVYNYGDAYIDNFISFSLSSLNGANGVNIVGENSGDQKWRISQWSR